MPDALLPLLPDAVAHWKKRDPVLAAVAEEHPPEPWPEAEDDAFVSLARAIVHQQVSLAAGRTIFARFEEAVGAVTPETVLATPVPALRSAGLSGQKTTYLLDLATRTADGRLDLAGLADMPDDEAASALTAVKGIGPWSAKMFLLFHLGRPDVCPWEDLGVRLAVERFYGVPESDAAAWLRNEARPLWSPYNSVAARVLWTARRATQAGTEG